jgi:hypothetical protein
MAQSAGPDPKQRLTSLDSQIVTCWRTAIGSHTTTCDRVTRRSPPVDRAVFAVHHLLTDPFRLTTARAL